MYTCKPFCQVFVYFPAKVLEVLFCPHFPISCANLSLTGVEALKTRKQRSELPLIRQRQKTFIWCFYPKYFWVQLLLGQPKVKCLAQAQWWKPFRGLNLLPFGYQSITTEILSSL